MYKPKILVTGGRGFLGQAVCKQLEPLSKVIAIGRDEADLRCHDQTNDILEYTDPDIIVHLAATVGGIGANKENPGKFIEENLIMGYNIIKLAKERNIKKFVMLGTVCAYPKHCPVPFKEEDLWNGYPEETNAPYGIAKKTLMQLVQSYHQQYAFNGINLIPVNMYGPNDNFNPESSHVIPALILKFQQAIDNGHEPVEIWGTGKASREFLYVDDCAEAIKLAILNCNEPDPTNIGTGKEITIMELAQTIQRIMGHKGSIWFNSEYPDGQPRRCLDTSKAKERFDFEATTDFDTGLTKTIEWFRNDYSNS
jgi:GDP-L-fucose synthase